MVDEIADIEVKEKKGNYGDAKNKTANNLYKDYKAWAIGAGKKPLPFPKWIEWAKSKDLVKKNADGDQNVTIETETEKISRAVNIGKRLVFTVIILSIGSYLVYQLVNTAPEGATTT